MVPWKAFGHLGADQSLFNDPQKSSCHVLGKVIIQFRGDLGLWGCSEWMGPSLWRTQMLVILQDPPDVGEEAEGTWEEPRMAGSCSLPHRRGTL